MTVSLAEVAPVGPALGEPALAGFLALIAILLCIGALILKAGVAYWLRPLLNGIAWVLGHLNVNTWKIKINIGSWLAKQVLKLEHIVEHYLGRVADAMAGTSNVLFHHAGALMRLAWTQLEGLAADVVWSFQQFRKYVVPKLVKALMLTYIGEALLGKKLLKWIAREIGALVSKALRYVYRKLHSVETRVFKLTRVVAHAGAVAIPHAIPGLRAEIISLKRLFRSALRWWHKLRWLVALGSIAALTAAVLKKAGLRWLTCRNVNKTGKAICRMPPGLINVLLGEALGVLVITDICDTVRLIEGVAERFEPVVRGLVVATDDLVDHCGHEVGSAMDSPGYGGSWLASAL